MIAVHSKNSKLTTAGALTSPGFGRSLMKIIMMCSLTFTCDRFGSWRVPYASHRALRCKLCRLPPSKVPAGVQGTDAKREPKWYAMRCTGMNRH
jgi:hypothetical protein